MWRRDPQIINLYDKPAYPRPRRRPSSSTSSAVLTALLSCTMILVGTAGFFWAYDAIAHHDRAFVPTISAEAAPSQRWHRSAEAAPKPNMLSSAVMAAEADVPATQRVAQTAIPERPPVVENKANVTPKKKKVHVVRRPLAGPALGYAAGPAFYQAPAPFGGW